MASSAIGGQGLQQLVGTNLTLQDLVFRSWSAGDARQQSCEYALVRSTLCLLFRFLQELAPTTESMDSTSIYNREDCPSDNIYCRTTFTPGLHDGRLPLNSPLFILRQPGSWKSHHAIKQRTCKTQHKNFSTHRTRSFAYPHHAHNEAIIY